MSAEYIDVKGWGRLRCWSHGEGHEGNNRGPHGVQDTKGKKGEADERQLFPGRLNDAIEFMPYQF